MPALRGTLVWRLIGLLALLVAGWVPEVPAEGSRTYRLEPVAVGDGVWMIEGGPGHFDRDNGGAIVNIGLIETDQGVVLVDAGPSRAYGEALQAAVRRTFGRPVQRVLLTHRHPDHVLGAQVFPSERVCAAAGTRAVLAEEGQAMVDDLFRLLGDWMRGTRAVQPGCSLEAGTIDVDGRQLRILAAGGHSGAEGDWMVLDVASDTLFAGDLVFSRRAPTTPHADLRRWRQALTVIEALAPARVIPGHGPLQPGLKAVADTRRWLDALEAGLWQAAAAGLSMGEALALPVDPAFAAWDQAGAEYVRSVNHLYPGIMARVLKGESGP